MKTLLLRLQGPMQAWGTTSRFEERDTQLEPSKSGVIGLVCAALGRDRSLPVDDLAQMKMGVRVDREGTPMRDYQTAEMRNFTATGKPSESKTVVSPRFYLADAAFLVGLESDNEALLMEIHQALAKPFWPLALGRKSCVPTAPVHLPDGLVNASLQVALTEYVSTFMSRPSGPLRLVMEHPNHGSVRMDQPVGPYIQRRFGPRFVVSSELSFNIIGASNVPDPAAA